MIECASAPCRKASVTNPARSECPPSWCDLGGGEPGLFGAAADHLVHRVPGHRAGADGAGLVHRREQRPARVRRVREPGGAAARAAGPPPRPAAVPSPTEPAWSWRPAGGAPASPPAACRPRGRCRRRAAPPATARTRRAGRSPGPARTAAPSPGRGPPGRSSTTGAGRAGRRSRCRVTSARVRATSSERRCAPANPISSSAMSRRAATPAGQPPATTIEQSTRPRMSSSSSGARRTGGVARIRRIPDNARRTTSDRPGGVQPGGGVELVDRRTPTGSASPGRTATSPSVLLGGRLGDVVRDHRGGAGRTGTRARSPRR